MPLMPGYFWKTTLGVRVVKNQMCMSAHYAFHPSHQHVQLTNKYISIHYRTYRFLVQLVNVCAMQANIEQDTNTGKHFYAQFCDAGNELVLGVGH
mmetsp:Transcript_14210/g.20723  ORF Transcript_14210/g.20723 Transcript_14210/m.20723 type:complete len:95 (+) Transcript_14210:510-794(+)